MNWVSGHTFVLFSGKVGYPHLEQFCQSVNKSDVKMQDVSVEYSSP